MSGILLAGGFDPLARAGLLADLQALARLELQAEAALVTAQTVQNDQQMRLWGEPLSRLRSQLELLNEHGDLGFLKTGILVDAQQAELFLELIPASVEWVLDPVLESSSGRPCYLDDCQDETYRRLLQRADLITPNLPEARRLTGLEHGTAEDLLEGLKALGAKRILLKGGHGDGSEVEDLVQTSQLPVQRLRAPRLPGSFRGTGCRLASLVVGHRSRGHAWSEAVQIASAEHRRWLAERS